MEVHRQKWRALEARRISLPGGDRLCFYEDSLRQLDDAIRAPSTEPELVERKAVSCWIASREVGLRLPGPSCPVPADISSGQPLEAAGEVADCLPVRNCTSAEVQVLREVKLQYWPSPSGMSSLRPEDVPTDAEAILPDDRLQYVRASEMLQVDAWRDDMPPPAPVVQDLPGRESSVGSLVMSGQRRS